MKLPLGCGIQFAPVQVLSISHTFFPVLRVSLFGKSGELLLKYIQKSLLIIKSILRIMHFSNSISHVIGESVVNIV